MPLYAVTVSVEDLHYEIVADDEEEAMLQAFERAHEEDPRAWYFDCHEAYQIDETNR